MLTCAVSRVATGGLALPSRRSRVHRAAAAVSTRSPHSRRIVTVRKATGDEDEGGSSDDGDIESKRYNEKISDQNFRADEPGAGCLMPPGSIINPGVALAWSTKSRGYTRAPPRG